MALQSNASSLAAIVVLTVEARADVEYSGVRWLLASRIAGDLAGAAALLWLVVRAAVKPAYALVVDQAEPFQPYVGPRGRAPSFRE